MSLLSRVLISNSSSPPSGADTDERKSVSGESLSSAASSAGDLLETLRHDACATLLQPSPKSRPPRGERTLLPCEVCGKAFDRPSLLKRHMRTHTGRLVSPLLPCIVPSLPLSSLLCSFLKFVSLVLNCFSLILFHLLTMIPSLSLVFSPPHLFLLLFSFYFPFSFCITFAVIFLLYSYFSLNFNYRL
jgi:hypothetical protein